MPFRDGVDAEWHFIAADDGNVWVPQRHHSRLLSHY